MFKLVLKDGYEEALVINMIIEEIEKQKKQAADIESSVGSIGCAADYIEVCQKRIKIFEGMLEQLGVK